MDRTFQYERELMVADQILARGVTSPAVLEALREIPRHRFVPSGAILSAYADKPLAIACGQTISQPYMVALMTALLDLQPEDCVLEIGTGSGYQTALLARLARRVVTVERHEPLSRQARQVLEGLGMNNIRYVVGDGSAGYPEEAPYNAILVTAACSERPRSLAAQLAEGGRLIAPVGAFDLQQLVCIVRKEERLEETKGISCRFVPLIGGCGWPSPE